jgi:Transmembrane amino acid transporter protein
VFGFFQSQVFAQPIFQFFESYIRSRYPDNKFIHSERIIKLPVLGNFPFSPFRMVWRTLYVIVTAFVAMIFPFFNDFLGLIGALSFWPLTVYFPVEMYKKQSRVQKFSKTWVWLNTLSLASLVVSILAACGSVQGLIQALEHYKPFNVA